MTTKSRMEAAILDYRIARTVERRVLMLMYGVLGGAVGALLVLWVSRGGR